jgi:serine/threonine protein kinase
MTGSGPGDDRTLVRLDPAASVALAPGTRLRDFEIERVVGEGGFSIVYAAHDVNLQRRVAIKEYLPTSLATRGEGDSVIVRSKHTADSFEAGRRSFLNEARLLARFDHPALVKVHQFWESHGTAYMVMPLYEGVTLKQWLRENPFPDEAWLRRFLEPLLEALDMLHRAECYHRDIAPDNVLVLPGEQPLLLDFGAARRIISDQTQSLTVILKPGYAPVEQYAAGPALKQGPWTDVYALCAVVYFAVTGRPPPPSVGRLVKDDLEPLSRVLAGRYDGRFLAAIDAGLALRPEDRPQTIEALRVAFASGAPSRRLVDADETLPAIPLPSRPAAAKRVTRRSDGEVIRRPGFWVAAALAAAVLGAVAWFALRETPPPESPSPPDRAMPAAPPPPPPSPSPAKADLPGERPAASVPMQPETKAPPEMPPPKRVATPPKEPKAAAPGATPAPRGRQPGQSRCALEVTQRWQQGEITTDQYREQIQKCPN